MAAKKKVKLVPTAAPTTKSKNSSTSSAKATASKNTSARSTVEQRRAAGRKALWEQTRKEQEERRRKKYGQIEPLSLNLPEQRNLSPTASGKPLNTSYDAQFVPDYFENSDYYKALIDIPYESMTTRQKGEHLDMFWRFQAGANNMRETGMTDEYPDSDAIFGMNDSVNRNISDKYLKDFLSEASEEDVRWLLGDLDAKYADATKYGDSNYSRYVGDGLNTIRDYARNHYSSFANEEIDRIGGELAKLNIQMKNASNQHTTELLSEANNALGWMETNDPISVVANSPRLSEAVGFEKLEQQYGDDEMAFTDELRRRVAELAETEASRQGMNADATTEYQPKYDALMREMNDAVALRDGLIQTENYNRMLGENWVGSAAGRFNPEDYQWAEGYETLANEYGDTQTQYRYNAPTIAQIVEDPETVRKAYDQAIAMGADPSKNEDILQVQQMTDEELRLYQALYAIHGEEEAQKFYDHLAPELADRVTGAYVADKTAFAKEHPFLASAASIPEKFMGSLAGTADMIAGRDGKNQFSAIAQAERETVGQNIAEATPWANVNGTNLVSAAYQGAMSFMDSMFNRALTAGTGSAIAGDVLLGMGAASDAYANAYEATDGDWGKAVITGIASGLIEAGSEHISWGKLSNPGDLGVPGGVWKYIASASATEGLEEVVSGLGGSAIESLVLGQDGEIPSRYKYYTQNGYTSTEAIGRIAKELGWETTLEFLIGALMGGTAAGVNTAVQMPVINAENRQVGETLTEYGDNDSSIMRGFLDLAGTLDLSRKGRKIYEELTGQYARNEALDSKNAQAQANAEQREMTEAAEEPVADNAQKELPAEEAQQTFEETAGTEIESPSDSFDPYGYNAIESVALAAGERGDAVRSMYEEGQDAAKYARQFALAMECGQEALDVNSVLESGMFSELTQEQITVAYSIGRNGGGNQHLDNNSQFFTDRGNALAELYRVQTSKLTDKSMADRMLDVAAQSAGEKGDIVRDMLLDWQNRERYASQIEKAVRLGREGGDLNAARDSKEFSELTWSQLATAYAIGMESTSQDSDTALGSESAQANEEIAEDLSTESARQELAEEKASQADIKAQERKNAEIAKELDSDSAREELTEEKNAQAQENAERQKNAKVAKELSAENARAELAPGKGKAAVNKAKVGRLYREVMQKLEGNAQKTLRERMSYDVAKELVSAGVDRSEAYNLAMSILRVQDGSATQEDLEAVNGNSTARDVLLAYTAKVKAESDAAGKVDELRGLLAGKPPKSSTVSASDATDDTEAPDEPLYGDDEFDAVIAEVQEQEMLVSEGETSTLDGEEIEILGVEAAGDAESGAPAKVRIRTADGAEKTVEAKEIAYSANDESVRALAAYSSEYGRQGDMMYNAYQPGQDVTEYARAFHKAAQAGSDGKNLDVLKSSGAVDVLNDKQLGIAYEIGRTMRATRSQAQQAALQAKGAGIETGGLDVSQISMASLNKQQRDSVTAMGKLAKALGFNVRFVESKANAEGRYTTENGSYDASTRTLTLDVHAGSNYASDTNYAVMHTAGHELTHYIKQFADSKLWDEFQDFVMGHLDKKMDLEAEIQKKMAGKQQLTRDAAIEEIMADASGEALSKLTADQIQEMAEENPSLMKKIASFVKTWIGNLKRQIEIAFKGTEAKTEAARQMQDALDEMAAKWNAMLVNAGKQANATKAQKKAPAAVKALPKDDVKYSTRDGIEFAEDKYYSRLIDQIENAKDGSYIRVGGIQEASVLNRVGLPAASLYFDVSKIKKQLEKHGDHLDKNVLKKIPDILRDPVVVAEAEAKNTVNVFGDLSIGDSPVMVAIMVARDRSGRNIINKVRTIHARRDFMTRITDENVLYLDTNKKRTRNWFQARGNVVPLGGTRYGFIRSIAQPEDSVKFSMREPVESTKNLIAVHNLNEYKLGKALKLGGFPMPSIAIAKADIGHQNFGDISLVFGRETIDPKVNRKNKVYSADAWTPTFPKIEYEADPKAEKRMRTTLTKLGNSMESYLNERLRQVIYGVDEYLNRYEGEEGFIEYVMQNYGVKAAFLEDQGQHVDMVRTKKRVGKVYPDELAASYQKVVDLFDGDMEKASHMPLGQIKEEYGAALEDIRPGSTKSAMRLSAIIRNAAEYQETASQPPRYEMVADYGATERSIDEQINKPEFEAWVRDLFSGIEGNSGVYNNKPLFTDSGNRRSFASTHMPVTVENIAKAMATQGNTKNVAGFHGIKSVRAATARTFKNVDEMHAYEGRIQNRTEDEAELLNRALNGQLYDLIHEVLQTKQPNSNTGLDYAYAEDALGEIFLEIAESMYSVSSIQRTLAGYGYNVSTETAKAIKLLFDDTAYMPVNMYKAKPERAVGFDEVRFAVVPDDISNDLLNELRKVVPDVRTYPAGDEAARLAVLNSEDSVRFQERDPDQISDRELLATALQSVTQNADEWDNLRRYQNKIATLNEKQRLLEQTNARIAELTAQDSKANRDELIRLKNAAAIYTKQINRADGELLKYDAMKPIKKLADREREAYKQKLKAKTDEQIRRYKERVKMDTQDKIREIRERAKERADERVRKAVQDQREIDQRKVARLKESHGKEKYRAAIMADVKKLYGWVVSPTNKGHVPQFLREPLGKFLESIDFSSASSLKGKDATKNDRKFMDALDKLRYAISDLSNQQSDIEGGASTFAGYIDLPSDYMAEFDALVRKIKTTLEIGDGMTDTAFNRMTADQLHEMSKLFRILNSSITKMNHLVANGRYESARTASNDTIADMNAMKAKVKTNKVLSTLNSMFNWKNATPYYAFQRLGRGGKAIFEGLQDGWDKMARNSAELIAYAKEAFTAKQAKTWSNDIQTIKLDSGESVQMTVSQMMSLYCLSKREQAVGHLKGGGIRVSDIDAGKGNTISQVDNYILSEADIARIAGKLTAEQKAVADKLQKFMNTTCSEWGNEISMKRFGYEMFTEKNYFPIETDANNRSRIDDKQDGNNSMFRLLNMSAMKQLTPNANNAIIVRDIFDVFSNHASDMGKYNALALPILDFIKWYNFVERADVIDEHGNPTGQITTRSTQKALERAYGSDAKSYLMSFIKDLNAEHDGGRNDTVLSKLMGTAKAGSVNANMRVGFLQITSLPRAAYAINPKYLLGGMAKLKSLNPVNAIRGTAAQEDIGILKWKSLGFYSTDVARSTRGLVRRDDGAITKVRDFLMKPAEWGDNWVSNIIYEAAKLEMKDKHPALKPGTKAYDAMLNKRVREIVYKTQVVDSTMTRSDFMRSKGLMTAFTAFMSEPTLTVNMLNESIQEAVMNSRSGMSKGANLKSVGGKVVRATAVFAFTALASALVESIFDAMRDDDDYEELEEKFAAAFTGNIVDNVNVLGMLPILKDLVSIAQGYENNSMVTQAATQVMDVKKAIEAVQKGDRPVYSAIYNALKVVASTTGVGVQNATRDGVALYNTFLADAWGQPKIQTYENSKSEAAKAYYAAIKTGDTEKAEWILERAEVNGLTEEELSSNFSSIVRNEFNAGNVDAATAERYLIDMAGKDADAAYWLVREWEYTGADEFSKYGSLKTSVASGDRNAATAAYRELVEHGTKEETVAEQLSKLYNSGEATSLLNLQMRSNQLYTSTLKLKTDGQAHKDDFDAFITAVVNGSGVASEIRKLREKGYTTKQIMSAINGAFGKTTDRYGIMQKYNSREAAILLDRILDAYEALGLNRKEELAWINENWAME